MTKIREHLHRRSTLKKKKQNDDAEEAMLEEAFNDLYRHRRRIYMVNLFRGIFFGAGSALGGTLVIAVIVWMLSWFVNFPLIGQYFEDIKGSIQQTSHETTNKVND